MEIRRAATVAGVFICVRETATSNKDGESIGVEWSHTFRCCRCLTLVPMATVTARLVNVAAGTASLLSWKISSDE